MSYRAFVPVKRLEQAKSRLGASLSSSERADLARAMLAHVLTVASASTHIAERVVVTADPAVAAFARMLGAVIFEDRASGLNAALEAAVSAFAPADTLILLGDLPWLDTAALDAWLGHVPPGGAGIASDQHRRGTSALAWRSDALRPRFAFGTDSFSNHVQAIRDLGAPLHIEDAAAAFHDVDDDRDRARLAAGGFPAATTP